MARHALGVLGVVAASILLAVSAMMNYRFGFSLGKTSVDGQIYGMASAAADCFKALVPFFFFAAVRNRMWSQALAASIVWGVVTAYSMTSALGHAALNRLDTAGQRAIAAATYKDLRADSKRVQEQLTWIPAHRPAETVAAELEVMKDQRYWATTHECTEVVAKSARDFCQQLHRLTAEHASALEAQKLETRITEIAGKLAQTAGGTAMAEADPQASVLARLGGFEVEKVQTALTVFVALLIEIGSAFGMYVAFAYWRMHDPAAAKEQAKGQAPASERDEPEATPAVWSDAAPPASAEPSFAGQRDDRRHTANDNRVPNGVPDSDIQRHYRQRVVSSPGSNITAQDLYDDYCDWCEEEGREALPMPTYSREFKTLGVRKDKMGGRIRYFDVELRAALRRAEEKAEQPATAEAA
jgi:hypothetical protein